MKPVYPKDIVDMAYLLYGYNSCPNDFVKLAELNNEEFTQLLLYVYDDESPYFNPKFQYVIDKFL